VTSLSTAPVDLKGIDARRDPEGFLRALAEAAPSFTPETRRLLYRILGSVYRDLVDSDPARTAPTTAPVPGRAPAAGHEPASRTGNGHGPVMEVPSRYGAASASASVATGVPGAPVRRPPGAASLVGGPAGQHRRETGTRAQNG